MSKVARKLRIRMTKPPPPTRGLPKTRESADYSLVMLSEQAAPVVLQDSDRIGGSRGE